MEKKTLDEVIDFPKLSVEEIKNEITFGPYQIEQSLGYIGSNIKRDGANHVYVNKEALDDDSKVIRFICNSRHSRNKEYSSYVNYLPNHDGLNAIVGWYCICRNEKELLDVVLTLQL